MSIGSLIGLAAGVMLALAQGREVQAPARLEEFVPQLMREAYIPGLSMAVIRDGKISWHRGFGVRSSAGKDPVTDETVFEAASLSKPVCAYAVLKLADAGKLDLDAPLARYLPGDYIEGDERVRRITVRMVLSHTPGFPNWRPRGKPLVLHFEPGERFSYSGEGYVYLQKVIEHLTGEPLNAVVTRLVFEPLGMAGSGYVWRAQFDARAAAPHGPAGAPGEKNKPVEANAAASLHTTAVDYAKFMAAVLSGAGLKEETARQMLSPQVKLDDSCVTCVNRPAASPSASLAWGLGWGLELTDDGTSFWHWGDNGNFKCYAVASVRRRAGVVFFTNSANGLSVVQEMVDRTLGGRHPALAWIKYDRYDSPTRTLIAGALRHGAEAALAQSRPGDLKEREINGFGYDLLRLKRVKEAIEVFKLNVGAFPNSANAYDSLGEAYLTAGEKALAMRNYKKSVELDPNNKNGLEKLKELEGN